MMLQTAEQLYNKAAIIFKIDQICLKDIVNFHERYQKQYLELDIYEGNIKNLIWKKMYEFELNNYGIKSTTLLLSLDLFRLLKIVQETETHLQQTNNIYETRVFGLKVLPVRSKTRNFIKVK